MDQETLDKLSDDEILAMRGMTKEQGEEEAAEMQAKKLAHESGQFFWKQNGATLELIIPEIGGVQFISEIDFDTFDDDDFSGAYWATLEMACSNDKFCIFEGTYDTLDEAKTAIESALGERMQLLFRSSMMFLSKYFPNWTLC